MTMTGQRLRDEALSLLERRKKAYVRRGCRLMLTLNRTSCVSTDDVREAMGELRPGVKWHFLGSVTRSLMQAGLIQAAGWTTSKFKETHARPVRLWVIVDQAAADQWLRDHPEIEVPPEGRLF